jgi:hypothetical protein
MYSGGNWFEFSKSIVRKKWIYHGNMFLWINDLSLNLIYIFRDLVEKDVSVDGTLFEYLNMMIVLTYFYGRQYRANRGCWILLLSADRIRDNSYKREPCMSGKKPRDS